jgi:hypothetical protein
VSNTISKITTEGKDVYNFQINRGKQTQNMKDGRK